MNRLFTLLVALATILCLPAMAQNFSGPATGSAAAGPETHDTNTPAGSTDLVQPPPNRTPYEAQVLQVKATPPARSEKPDAIVKVPGTMRVSNLPVLARLEGLDKTPSDIADPGIAVGSSEILQVVNATYAVFNKAGRKAVAGPLVELFKEVKPPSVIYQPQCFYDPRDGRFVVAALARSAGTEPAGSYWLLAVSKDSTALGPWWSWKFDAVPNGEMAVKAFADNFSLGFNENLVALSANMYSENESRFMYSKVRLLDKRSLYNGQPAVFTDYWDLKFENGRSAASVSPARIPYGSSPLYFAAVAPDSGSFVALWRAEMISSRPNLVFHQTVKVRSYNAPPDAMQRGSSTLIATGPCRIQSPCIVNGSLYAVFTEYYPFIGTSAAGIRYLVVRTSQPAAAPPTATQTQAALDATTPPVVLTDITIGNGTTSYFNPSVIADRRNNSYLAFNFSDPAQFPGLGAAGFKAGAKTMEGPIVLASGSAPWEVAGSPGAVRFGSVTAIALDPELDNFAWVAGAFVRRAGVWNTAIDGLSFDPLRWHAALLPRDIKVPVMSDSLFKFAQTERHWNVVGLRSPTNWRLEMWDANFTTLRARSSHDLMPVVIPVEFCVSDANHNPLDTMGVKVKKLGADNGTLQFFQAQSSVTMKSDALNGPYEWRMGDVVQAYDLELSNTTDTCIALTVDGGDADLGIAIFRSNNTDYYASRYEAVALADNNGPGQGEYLTYRPSSEDFYCVVVWANNQAATRYSVTTACALYGHVAPNVKVDKFGLRVIDAGAQGGETKIAYDLPGSAKMTLRVYSADGRLVRTLAAQNHAAGSYEAGWDGRNAAGRTVAAGTYYARLESPEYKGEVKIVRLR